MRTLLVSGYVPIPGHPRLEKDYKILGEKLLSLPIPKHVFYDTLEDCWMDKLIKSFSGQIMHSAGDNPAKNTLNYHIVQHQKIEWLRQAAIIYPDIHTFVWCDFGVFGLPGITKELIVDFFTRVNNRRLSIPGCWEKGAVSDASPCWRFCGTMLVCPRRHVFDFDVAIKDETKRHLLETNTVSWEINTWSRVENQNRLPIKWYPANHNASLFSNYKGTTKKRRTKYHREYNTSPGGRLAARRYYYKTEYGISIEEKDALFAAQGYKCAVPACGATEPGRKKSGWHLHHTGEGANIKVHGVLCHRCNLALSKTTTPIILRSLAEYMEKHQ
jgi:hypothetical protein